MPDNDSSCIPCGLQTFRRNTYFNGKLLTERDFKDEQAYLVGKDRIHNAYLHGTGTVCGLSVTSHPNPECRHRFVVLEPGMALDCCGREIIVPERTVIDIAQLLDDQNVSFDLEGGQDLFLSICYEEAGDEKVPMILPDCDCAVGNDAWNRIAERYSIKIEAPQSGQRIPVHPPSVARMEWLQTLVLQDQNVKACAVDEETGQAYVATLNDEGGGRVMVYDTTTHDLITAFEAGQRVHDIVTSPRGDLIYISGVDTDGTRGVWVYREADIRGDDPTGALIEIEDRMRLLVGRDGVLFVLALSSGSLFAWQETAVQDWLTDGAPAPGPANRRQFDLGHGYPAGSPAHTGANMMAASDDGRYVLLLDPEADNDDGRVRIIDIAQLFSGPAAPDPNDEIVVSVDLPGDPMALAISLDGEYLFVLSQNGAEAHLTKLRLTNNAGLFTVAPEGRGGRWLADVQDLLLAPGEKWAYALEISDEEQTSVVSLSIDAISTNEGEPPVNPSGSRENISGAGRSQRLAALGNRLYVVSNDASEAQPSRGLVAIIDVTEGDCGAIFDRVIDPCPSCNEDGHHCVTLAHVPRYQPGLVIQNEGDGAEDDVMIDNLTYRPLVPSSSSIVDVVRCMLEEGFAEGRPGPRGPVGLRGLDGADGQDGQDGEDGQDGTNGTNGTNGTSGTNGQDGQGLNEDLVHITNVSWIHDAVTFDGLKAFTTSLQEVGIVILFDQEISMDSVLSKMGVLSSEVFTLFARVGNNGGLVETIVPFLDCQPVNVDTIDGGRITAVTPLPEGTPFTQAIRLTLGERVPDVLSESNPSSFRVLLRADMIADKEGKFAVDGNHIFGAVPGRPSGNGLQGGDFESWFAINQ